MSEAAEVDRLRREVAKLEKINRALMLRVERNLDQGSAFGLFESAVSLENEVRQRTSALRAALRELSSSNEELRAATLAADAANRAKSEFIARISHELRTPMNGVMGMTELLIGTDLDPNQQRAVQAVARSAKLLLRVIDDVLDFTKFEQDKLVLEHRGFSIATVLDDTLELMGPAAEARGIVLRQSIDRELPEFVIGDSIRVRQILTNLIGNAVKFTPHGAVAVRCTQLRREGDEVELKLEVEDTGVGIPPAALEHIFNAFTQADGSTTRTHGGTGLGLAIVRQLVCRMRGEIAVRSEVGVGSTFTATLWLGIGERPAQERSQPSAAPTAMGLHVLLAEDDDVNVEVLTGMLERLGCTYEVVRDGLAAVDAVSDRRFDALLMDWHMPLLDGLGATAKIRDEEGRTGRARQVIIAVTSNALPADRSRCAAVGMDGFLSKPFSLRGLANALEAQAAEAPAVTRTSGPLDLGVLVELIELDPRGELFDRVLDLFLRETQRALTNLEVAATAEDVGRIADEAHKLSSSCGYVGALEMAAMCRTLQDVAGSGADNMMPWVVSLAAEFERVRARLPTARTEARRVLGLGREGTTSDSSAPRA